MNRLKLLFVSVLAFVVGCAEDEDGNELSVNTAPESTNQQFYVNENVVNQFFVGTVLATDKEGDNLTFEIINDTLPFIINENSGEITVSNSVVIDFETKNSYDFEVLVSDGEFTTQVMISIVVNNVAESSIAKEEQERLIEVFKYMSLFKSNSTPDLSNRKWKSTLNIFVSGDYTINDEEVIEGFISELNGLNTEGLELNRVSSLEEANVEIWVATFDDLTNNRPDFAANAVSTNRGYAYMQKYTGSKEIFKSSIWLNKSSYEVSTIKHEMFHILGFGHSLDVTSLLHSPSRSEILSDDDVFVIEALYSKEMNSNSNEEQIEESLLAYFLTI